MPTSSRRVVLSVLVAVAGSILSSTAFAFIIAPRLSLVDSSADDQDDLCIWIHPTDPSLSTIITSDKVASRVFVYDLQGAVIQELVAPGEPGNIDVRYGFPLTGELVDIVALNDRTTDRIVVYEVAPATRTLARLDSNDLISADSYGLASTEAHPQAPSTCSPRRRPA